MPEGTTPSTTSTPAAAALTDTLLTSAPAASEAATPDTTSQGKPGEGAKAPGSTSETKAPAKADDKVTDGKDTQEDGKGEGDKGEPEGKPKDGTPEALELKLPEGVQADEQLMTEFKALAQESGLKGPQAQKVVDLYVNALKKQAETSAQLAEKQILGWRDAVKSDEEMGGAAYEKNAALAKRGFEKFATPELKQILNATGLGDHPELVRFCMRIGKSMSEGSYSGGSAPVVGQEKQFPDLYPNTTFSKG